MTAATSTRSAQSHQADTKTGWFSGGLSVGYGTRTTTTDRSNWAASKAARKSAAWWAV